MAANGRLSGSELSPIPGGELRHDAAAAWNAPGGPADNGLRPGGSMSSYRTYDEQVYLYGVYQRGGNLAAYPGSSNHGWGVAIDIPNGWEQEWMRQNAGRYGWAKTEAMSEPWHWNYVGGVSFPSGPKPLQRGDKGKRVLRFGKRLAYIRGRNHYAPYMIVRPSRRFGPGLEKAVKAFQRDQGLPRDGVIGPHTARRINHVFERQWRRRGKDR